MSEFNVYELRILSYKDGPSFNGLKEMVKQTDNKQTDK